MKTSNENFFTELKKDAALHLYGNLVNKTQNNTTKLCGDPACGNPGPDCGHSCGVDCGHDCGVDCGHSCDCGGHDCGDAN